MKSILVHMVPLAVHFLWATLGKTIPDHPVLDSSFQVIVMIRKKQTQPAPVSGVLPNFPLLLYWWLGPERANVPTVQRGHLVTPSFMRHWGSRERYRKKAQLSTGFYLMPFLIVLSICSWKTNLNNWVINRDCYPVLPLCRTHGGGGSRQAGLWQSALVRAVVGFATGFQTAPNISAKICFFRPQKK